MRLAIYIILALVAVQRLVEVAYAERNTRALIARGAVEIGRAHYPLIVILHAAWLIAIVLFLPPDAIIHWWALGLFIALQLARVWVIATLGPYWTTRIITLSDAPLVRKGPYRFVRHPNYLVVAGEIAVLPLAFGEVNVAIVFTLLNAAMLAWRIRQEETALTARRALS
ncbi:MAG TPA: isoprenylcysteine carboxylmethyltransferase family protein [Rhizomicrobium sp.]|jgi:methyltransferase|nr:isoprenylcysteine carboxylmethyltransferase family protein [Rhizomicrobium sp.]